MTTRRRFLTLSSLSVLWLAAAGLGPGFGMPATAAPSSNASPEQVRDFFRAVQMDDTRTVQSLLRVVDPNGLNPVGGEPALVVAVREGSMNVLKLLLAHPGTQVDASAMNGNTALMMAAYKRNMAAVEALLAKGAAVNRPGWTALHYAAAGGDNDIAALLLKRGARVDAVSPAASGAYTPLMMAAREGHEYSALFLLERGANPMLKNGEGLTAAQIAERADHKAIAGAIRARLRVAP
ncbi:ankyrin repeat domain-containing protein [Massilia sp. 9096]|uniref:ankyrin repeat domain-containing protein n=1 Tax=Massilia sp. 9096 TaxID=1500894 RepID=UPI0006916CDC|nr:ankyrin repeat domain-containing protein [Massilia sp. 9096]